jgi:hypothetical protein
MTGYQRWKKKGSINGLFMGLEAADAVCLAKQNPS